MAPKGLLALHTPDLNKYCLTSLGELNKTLYAYLIFFFLDGCCMLNSNYTIMQKVEEGFFF